MAQLLQDLAYGTHPRQVMDLFLPDEFGARLFVFVHGGGWRGGDKSNYRALGELLSGFGYAVALPNHRLAPEYPHPAAAQDVASAIACVLRYGQESGISSEGMFLGGHSSGAHLAALLATDPRYSPEASIAGVICISGVYDLTSYEDATEYLEPVFGDRAHWAEASPIRHVGPHIPPFFLAHAEFDYPGAGIQAEAMARAIRGAGSEALVTSVPGRDHITILTGVRSLLDPLAVGLALFLRGAQEG